jgi:hypothetical protein
MAEISTGRYKKTWRIRKQNGRVQKVIKGKDGGRRVMIYVISQKNG